ncbi:replication protein A, subunit RPA32 [Backusella circina FSU 941]|nr:replication protein A, subunit RPA32 [Backusella circina FSU 941]
MDGGGYINTYSSDTTSQAGSVRKPLGEQSLRPLTIKQIKSATMPQEGVFRVDNADVTQITFIGVIRNANELQTNITYTIEDGTGAVEVRKWRENNESLEDTDNRSSLMNDTYVRVYGRLNNFNDHLTVVAYAIKPITDYNEITYHFLDAIKTHLTLLKTNSNLYVNNGPKSSVVPSTGGNRGINDDVSDAIKSFSYLEEGASIDQIVFKLKGMYSEGQIKQSIEYLSNEGHCYQTFDENHFKSTE